LKTTSDALVRSLSSLVPFLSFSLLFLSLFLFNHYETRMVFTPSTINHSSSSTTTTTTTASTTTASTAAHIRKNPFTILADFAWISLLQDMD
jgi:hypothetical protein